MAGASHGGMPLDITGWQTITPGGIYATQRLDGRAPDGAPQDEDGSLLLRDYAAYQDAYNAEHN